MTMNSKAIPGSLVYIGQVKHTRYSPVKNTFKYDLPFFAFRLDELEEHDKALSLFSYNKWNITSIHDRDYMAGTGSIREKVLKFLDNKSYVKDISYITLITNPRYFGYIFNPVSFYYCYSLAGDVVCIVAEVNNTFKERHFYILDDEASDGGQKDLRYRHNKVFHVSPFNDLEGEYTFRFSEVGENIRVQITLKKQDKAFLYAELQGESKTLNQKNLQNMLMHYPVTAMLNVPRIFLQAGILYFRKGLKIHMKPTPDSEYTITLKKASIRERFAMNKVLEFMKKFRKGKIIMTLPDHEKILIGNPDCKDEIHMRVYDYEFFWNFFKYGDIAFGEGYTKGLWDCDDLTKLLETCIENRDDSNQEDFMKKRLGRIVHRVQHRLNNNSIRNSSKNIEAHYDLCNDFFMAFLDPSMTYSCANFEHFGEPLEKAQYRKIHQMIDLANVRPTDHVLEIGSGWGTLAIEAVKKTGCKVTTITLSKEQHKLVEERIKREGLQDKVFAEICDYRKMEGQFDKIISVEMFEAVGHENFGIFFKSLDRLLKPDGVVAMQVITIEDNSYESYRKNADWIQKYIFPGGLVPSISAIQEAMSKSSPFVMKELKDYGPHYGETLRRWRKTFWEKEDKIASLGFDDEFKRIWNYYLCYCESGFNTKLLGLVQFLLCRKE